MTTAKDAFNQWRHWGRGWREADRPRWQHPGETTEWKKIVADFTKNSGQNDVERWDVVEMLQDNS